MARWRSCLIHGFAVLLDKRTALALEEAKNHAELSVGDDERRNKSNKSLTLLISSLMYLSVLECFDEEVDEGVVMLICSEMGIETLYTAVCFSGVVNGKYKGGVQCHSGIE